MAWTVSVLVSLTLFHSQILEANEKIEYMDNGFCKFGYEVKVVSEKLGFSRDNISNRNVIVVHLDLQQTEASSTDFLNLQYAWNGLRPFWVREQYSDSFLRTLQSVEFQKYAFKLSKLVFRTKLKFLGTHRKGCHITAMPLDCIIRAISYALLRNVTGGIGFVCYDVFVNRRLRHVCCEWTTGKSVQCQKQPSVSQLWLDVLNAAEPYLVAIMVFVILFLPYTDGDNLSPVSDDNNNMVAPDQDVNPVTEYIKRRFVGKLVGNSSSQSLLLLVPCMRCFSGSFLFSQTKTGCTLFMKIEVIITSLCRLRTCTSG